MHKTQNTPRTQVVNLPVPLQRHTHGGDRIGRCSGYINDGNRATTSRYGNFAAQRDALMDVGEDDIGPQVASRLHSVHDCVA